MEKVLREISKELRGIKIELQHINKSLKPPVVISEADSRKLYETIYHTDEAAHEPK